MEPTRLDLAVRAGDLQITDPHSLLKECIIFFAFPKSKSSNFPIALGLAKAGTAYGEESIEGKTLYWAAFRNSPNDLKSAAELLRLAGNWVGTFTKINGRSVKSPFNAYLTLSCYQEALQCSSQAAHCHRIIDDPFHPNYDPLFQRVQNREHHGFVFGDTLETDEEIKEFVFPCKRMLEASSFHPRFSFERARLSTVHDQIQAAAVEYGISICPFFDATAFCQSGAHKQRVRIPVFK